MDSFSRFRVWFWILLVPVLVSSCLAMHLRRAAQVAQIDQIEEAERESSAAAAERRQQASLNASEKRQRQAEQQVKSAQRCARAARSMLTRGEPGPLLVVVTKSPCHNGCRLLRDAAVQIEAHRLQRLSGAWVISSSVNQQLSQVNARAEAEGLKTLVIDRCQDMLLNSQFDEDFVLLDSAGELLHGGAMHQRLANPDAPLRPLYSAPSEAMQKALLDLL